MKFCAKILFLFDIQSNPIYFAKINSFASHIFHNTSHTSYKNKHPPTTLADGCIIVKIIPVFYGTSSHTTRNAQRSGQGSYQGSEQLPKKRNGLLLHKLKAPPLTQPP